MPRVSKRLLVALFTGLVVVCCLTPAAGLVLMQFGVYPLAPFRYTNRLCVGVNLVGRFRAGIGWQSPWISAMLAPTMFLSHTACIWIPWAPWLPPGGGFIWPP